MKKILLLEDDITLSIGLEYTLKKEGFTVKKAKNLKEARANIEEEDFDLLLLDLMLPDGSGYDICKEVREKGNVPVIFMTACDEEANVVLGLDLGGDDYIIKPIRVKELLSRIKAVLRRHNKGSMEQIIVSGNIIIEPLKARVVKNLKEITLTPAEYKLLLILVENKGNVISRNVLLQKLWDIEGNFVDANTLNVYIKRLREKIEEDFKKPKYIKTIRGLGYRWSMEVRGEES